MHKTFFDLHYGHATAIADKIARRHGGRHVNVVEQDDRRRGWFEVPATGSAMDDLRIRAISDEVERRGGIEMLLHKRDRRG